MLRYAVPARRAGVSFALRHSGTVRLPPASTLRAECDGTGTSRRLRTGRILHRPVWWQFELAGPHLVSIELSVDRVAAEIPLLPGRRVHRRISVWIGRAGLSGEGGIGAFAAPHSHFSAG